MQNVNYDDVTYRLRSNFAESHTRYWHRLQSPGTWFNSAERIAIAQASREAQDCTLCQQSKAALSPRSLTGKHLNTTTLPPLVVSTIHAIVTDASRLTQSWYENQLRAGLSEGQYIEIVGTVVSMVSIDSFADALGIALRPLPAPEEGQPSHYHPATATITENAWVPMVDIDNEGTPEADLWVSGKTGNVVRAMSLVPDEVRTLKDLSDVHYLEMPKVKQPGVDAGRALNRSQMELVAGRVSALNACYY